MVLLVSSPCLADGIVITPSQIAPTIPAGDQSREIIHIQNRFSRDLTVRIRPDQNSKGVATFISADPGNVIIKAGETAEVGIMIRVDGEMEPGISSTIVNIDAIPSSGDSVAIMARVAVPVGVQVIRTVDEVSWDIPLVINSSESAVFAVQVRNSGSNATGLTETVNLRGIIGSTNLVSETKRINVEDRGTLETVWVDVPLFAVRFATLEVGNGIGTPVKKRALVIALPVNYLLIGGAATLAGLLVAVFIVYKTGFNRKNHTWRDKKTSATD